MSLPSARPRPRRGRRKIQMGGQEVASRQRRPSTAPPQVRRSSEEIEGPGPARRAHVPGRSACSTRPPGWGAARGSSDMSPSHRILMLQNTGTPDSRMTWYQQSTMFPENSARELYHL
ncbi:hypothetical protein NDU88_000910 [Pleurodeles waltl]|uniref:Uncharacterized protein n=1 Tax=Pleurodeles waltl TaxID=8319 RepID=A0AAV7KN72_PLEWA|nr:hypothetical protein NDU88_000910 [Pleurodeles waltl]